jgi:putative ABC transport system permease protein
MLNDLRFALRQLRKNPGFTAVVIVSLALGIGANTTIFSLIDAVLLKLLPVKDPQQLVVFAHRDTGLPSTGSNYPLYKTLHDRSQSFSGCFAFWPLDFRARTGAEAEPARGQYVTPNYFSVLGVQPIVGRVFSESDDAEPVAIISHGWWQRKFGSSRDVIGKTMVVNGTPLTVIGVTPPEFFGLQVGNAMEISMPLGIQPRVSPEFGDRREMREGTWSLCIVGRLKAGVELERARSEAEVLVRPWVEDVVLLEGGKMGSWARIELLPGSTGLDALRRKFSKPLQVLMAIVAMVLLIACANVATLLTARSVARQKEIAVRQAIGAGRARLIRQFLTESILLALAGGCAGLWLAWWGANLLVRFISTGPIPIQLELAPDWRVLSFTACVSVLTGILFGLAPAVRGTILDLTPTLKEGASPLAGASTRWHWGKMLVSVQVALSLTLLVGAALFVMSLRKIRSVDGGFRVENLLLVTFDTSGTGSSGPERRKQLEAFYREGLERASGLPGVRVASLSSLGPMSGDDSTRALFVPGFEARTRDDQAVHLNSIGTRFFETMGIPLLKGREFMPADDANAPKVAILNETAARFYFPGVDSLGQIVHMGWDSQGQPMQVVGIVRDSKRQDLRQPAPRMLYRPFLQYNQPYMTLEIRTTGDPNAVASSVRQAFREINRDIPVWEIKTMQTQIDQGLVQERLVATLSSFFGLLALLLSTIGLYGTISYAVTRRTSEIGIRMALGARKGDVLWLVLREATVLVLCGAGVGLMAATAMNRLIASMLFGLTPSDPMALVIATSVLLAVALLAAWLPARRASRVDPMVALRYE